MHHLLPLGTSQLFELMRGSHIILGSVVKFLFFSSIVRMEATKVGGSDLNHCLNLDALEPNHTSLEYNRTLRT
jgi:hypothetical protein